MAEDLSAMHGRAGASVTSVAMLQYRQACEVASCGALLFGHMLALVENTD